MAMVAAQAAGTSGQAPAATPASERGAEGPALGAVDGHEVHPEDAGADLPPERALRSPAGHPHLSDRAEAGAREQPEAVAHAEGDAFEHRARQVGAPVAQRSGRRTQPRASGSG